MSEAITSFVGLDVHVDSIAVGLGLGVQSASKVPFSNTDLSALRCIALDVYLIRTKEGRPIGILTPDRHAAVPRQLSKDARHARLACSVSGLDAAAGRSLRVRDHPFLFTTRGRAQRRVDPVPRLVASWRRLFLSVVDVCDPRVPGCTKQQKQRFQPPQL